MDATEYTVTVTLKLPSGVKAQDETYYNVYLRKANEFDADGKMIGGGSSVGGGQTLRFDSNGTGTVTINAAAGEYYLAVYGYYPAPGMYSGYTYFNADGTMASSTYDYAGSDWSTGNTAQQKIEVSGNKSGVDFTLTKAIMISGKFVTADGSKIEFTDGFTGANSWLYTSGQSYRLKIKPGGTWSAALPSSTVGRTFTYLEFSTSRDWFANLITTYYCYSEDGVCTSSNSATPVTITGEDITGLEVMVETGWKLTGKLVAPEDGYVNGVSENSYFTVSIYARSESSSYSASVRINSKNGPWTYTIVVPKEATEYMLEYNGGTPSSSFQTNIAFASRLKSDAFKVTGDMTGPTLTLAKIKTTITGTVTLPYAEDSYRYVYVYLTSANGTQYESGSIYIDTGKTTAEYSIPVPDTDTSTTYTMRYNTSGNYYTAGRDRILNNGYLTEDGVSSRAASKYAFTFGKDSDKHDFTLVERDYVIQSEHALTAGTYTYTHPVECGYMYLYFTYADLDVQIKYGDNETTYSANNYRSSKYVSMSGVSEVTLTITVPDDGNTYYGFAVDEVDAYNVKNAENAAFIVYTDENDASNESGMIEDIREGSDLNVVLVGDSYSETRQALAALYDENGRFLELVMVEIDLSYSKTTVVRFSFENAENVALVKVMLVDGAESFSPLMQEVVIAPQTVNK